ncbi:MAG: DUF1016 N-terminal domain-containing protein [Tannerella sp.]|jgi:predicted nuclease of restriction endonuclease-like (RecB) superfamily|nr:DUF1016 N-terminal domain-containing protein [Tannerella sp.]
MLINDNEYFEILNEIKNRIKTAQYKAVLGANQELICLYWSIGKTIIANTKYGAKFIDTLSKDIQSEFPDTKGFAVRNLKYMRKLATIFDDEQKVQSLIAQLSWTHNLRIMDTAKTAEQYEWYARQTIENGWSVRVLEYHIETKGYERQALTEEKVSNYQLLLPVPQSDLAVETQKSAYVFDFVEKRKGIIEREIEKIFLIFLVAVFLNLSCFGCKKYDNGNYCAQVEYYNPNTGTHSTYTLPVKVKDNKLTVIHFSNGGWLDDSHFTPPAIKNGKASFVSDRKYRYEIKILKKGA